MAFHWDDLRMFLAVHRKGSYMAAGRLLGVDSTTVGRRLRSLQESLGGPLFQRGPAGQSLTPESARLLLHAERIEAEVLASEREFQGAGKGLEGVIRVTAGDGLLSALLVPALGALLSRNPGLRVELLGDARHFDLARREADVGLRLRRPSERSLVRRSLGPVPFRLFASEQYLAACGRPTRVEELADHDFIGYSSSLDRTPPMAWLLSHCRRPPRVRCTLTATVAAACAAGQGIALTMPQILKGLPGIVEVLPGAPIPHRELWAVIHSDLRANPRVKAVLEWAVSAVGAAGIHPEANLTAERPKPATGRSARGSARSAAPT
ncbi:MAG TPA: LysR family transcriptional regulator [Myxococcales bacterium]|nr:LysR family transcriptional regulator [Myxococcales bacterium]